MPRSWRSTGQRSRTAGSKGSPPRTRVLPGNLEKNRIETSFAPPAADNILAAGGGGGLDDGRPAVLRGRAERDANGGLARGGRNRQGPEVLERPIYRREVHD